MIPYDIPSNLQIVNRRLNDFNKISYQTIVIAIAIFIFTITMVIFWFITPGLNPVYPPVMSNCPVGWSVNKDGTCNIPPVGSRNLGNLKGKPLYLKSDGKTYTTTYTKGATQVVTENKKRVLVYTKEQIPAGYDETNPRPVVDFTHIDWGRYGSTICANQEWAIKNNIDWEGITNYNQCN
jgi:hypothetical protein